MADILICGANEGIGLHMALGLLDSGHRVAVGVNYYPIKDIVLKGEYSIGLLKSRYNNEPSLSFGVAYAGLFNM